MFVLNGVGKQLERNVRFLVPLRVIPTHARSLSLAAHDLGDWGSFCYENI